ncbi:MAG: cytochrome P450 [Acidimicrobiia bacterium]
MATFNPYSSEFLADPYRVYDQLRDDTPAFFSEEWQLVFFTRHDDVTSILKDRDRFGRDFRHRMSPSEVDPAVYERIYPSSLPNWTRYNRESFIDLEPPRHTRLRRLVSKAFTRRSSEVFRERLETAADRVLDDALEAGSMEVISEFATPIPVAMIADLMGVPGEDHQKLIDWSNAIVKVYDENVSEDDASAAETATTEFVEYLEAVLAERRRNRGTDLITAMIEVEESGDTLTDEEIVATSILTLNAGHEATVHAIGNGMLALSRDPEAYQALRDQSVDLGRAVDELLRYDTPLQMFERWVLEDTEVRGQRLEKGAKVGLLFGAANHDPEVFGTDAGSLNLGRDPNPHVSFGAGLHYCVGAPLAKVELEAAFGRMASRVKGLELREVSDRIESLVFRGVGRLEVTLDPA